jgi:glycosyltransferase involved in cell wall biosynthesis
MQWPLVSVCIPAYNSADTIVDTMQSVLDQTYKNIELIVVDDRSRDDTWQVINQFREEHLPDSRVEIILYQNEKNLGMAGNWNRCLELCRGEYIKLLCADDLIDKSLIAREVDIMERYPEVNLVQSDTRFIDIYDKTTGFYRRYYKDGLIDGKEACRFSVFTRDYLGAPLANLIRRSAYEQWGGFDTSFIYIIDYDFFMKLSCHGKIYIIHEPLNSFRIRGDSNTGQVMNGDKGYLYIAEHRRLVEKYAEELELSRWQVHLSVQIRKVMSVLGGIYLKIFLK